ncbi:CaiB/BaiF CoA transferase family protein [Paraburkholderia diazotrophica]|uniref:Crotonobetainyl-CoA:carnitine CoA-transferase CaiB n=1 Tax=Paraburkholderia diazotrophica TaxID=667676 RepID=A0A1H7CK68_9BURK|nr:CaiB/BaiF CoA-transferase family protein [Paraburkholderia diazotrophica]SEJ90183.1 Crotonobetainyl-CoA:carnitine CoA-transferase CaiB [Paraburkholderia diazotrophica]
MKLTGLRVVDLSQFMPGPFLAAHLADHGAQVIKIEPVTGDPTRGAPGTDGAFFAAVNRGKRSIALDLKHPDGREAALKLIDEADVVIESSRPGVAARLGIDYDTMKRTNPRLVYCAMTAFGQNGPLSQLPAHDPVIQSLAGTLPRDSRGMPITTGPSLAALAGSLTALSAVLMALLRARETGRGDYIDLSLFDAALTAQPHLSGRLLNTPDGQSQEATEGDSGLALLNAYETADSKWLCLGGREHSFATNLLTPLGRPDLISDVIGPQGAGQSRVRAFLTQTFLTRTLAEWLDWFDGRNISVAPVLSLAEALNHPHTRERAMIQRDPSGRNHVASPIHFRNEPASPPLAVPHLGEHTELVLRSIGHSEERIAELVASGAARGQYDEIQPVSQPAH